MIKYSFKHIGGPLHRTIVDVIQDADGSTRYVARVIRMARTRAGSGALWPA